LKKENNKEEIPKKVCFKIDTKETSTLPTHPQTSIGRFYWQFEYGCGP